MTAFDNSNSGTFGKNKRKAVGDKKPDYTGSVNVNGAPHWLDGWIRVGPDGDKFISLTIKPKEQQARPQQRPAAPPADDSPF